MLSWHLPILTGHYPNMARADTPIWEAWLTDNAARVLRIAYDLAIGGVEITDDSIDQATRDGWRYSTAVKIDALVELEQENLVCEVKPQARLSALGQALGYAILLDAEPANDKPNTPTVITAHTTPEVRRVADALGIRIALVSPHGPPLRG